ncbi:hypothetical protein MTY414_59850 [Mycolicibacterium mageritense]|nr:hypothetical protein MTY414_59850 [Mycolicibacterium mageritense]
MPERVRIGSLFSGAGGLDMAVEEVFGGEVVWQCEFNGAASKVLAHRYPHVPNFGDVTAIDWGSVDPVDVMCGGYPCQPFSAAGQRKGTDDERHLWPYFAEAIRRVRPRYVVLENVAGHRSMGFDCVLGDLADIGYDAQWCSVRASDVGAPHRRERLFILAHPAGQPWRVDNGTELRAGWGAQRPGPTTGPGAVADAARDGRDKGRTESAGFVGGSDVAERSGEPVDLLPTPNAADGNGGGRLNSPGHQSTLPGTVRELLPTPRKSDGDGGANPLSRAERMDDVETRVIRIGQQWGKYEPAIRRWESVTRPAPAPTEPNSKGNPRLSPEFPEWMMGWPAGWVTQVPGISRNDQLRIIGNGVCPQQAVAALRWLLNVCEVAA